MLASMGGLWTRAIRSIGRGESGRTIWLRPKPSENRRLTSRCRPRGRVEVLLQLFGGQQRVELAADAVEPA
jgi:hypothetical protein